MVAKTKDAVTGKPVHGHWGGYDNDFGPSWWQIVMIITSPLLCYYIIAVGEKANWGVAMPAEMSLQGIWAMFPAWNWAAVPVVVAYIGFQVLTYLIVPGEVVKGPVTPAGNIQTFKINSLACWFVNVFVFMVFGWHGKWFDVSWASRNVGALFHVGCIWGFAVSILSYVKGHLFPTNSDAAIRNDVVQDFFLGIELSPRFPWTATSSLLHQLDFKLLTIGHIGMISWTIMNLSHAARQYQDFGHVSISMILVNIFQAVYTVDWAWKEVWYLFTIDMRHDRLGWYLGWGSHAWLPLTYCLQAWYLSMRSQEQVALTTIEAVGIVCTFLLGMTLFRLANNQKDEFRAAPTQNIWGRKPEYIEVKYSTGDNQQHTSLLLCSGYWGFSRHFNYLSDLIICLSFSLPCRGESILPYFYIVYMFMLLLHRSIRDDRKCRAKYGEHWDEYCRRVPYVLVPGLY